MGSYTLNSRKWHRRSFRYIESRSQLYELPAHESSRECCYGILGAGFAERTNNKRAASIVGSQLWMSLFSFPSHLLVVNNQLTIPKPFFFISLSKQSKETSNYTHISRCSHVHLWLQPIPDHATCVSVPFLCLLPFPVASGRPSDHATVPFFSAAKTS